MPEYKASYTVYKGSEATTESRTYHANNRADAERKGKDLANVLSSSLEARVVLQSVGLNIKKK